MSVILTISDLHTPWQHPDAYDFLRDLKRRFKPDEVICLGDEVDSAAWSRFPKNPHMPSPAEELRLARIALKPLFKLFPTAKVCISNHTMRPYLRASEAGLPDATLRGIGDVLDAPEGWTWHEQIESNGILFIHGDGFSGQTGAMKAAMNHRQSVVMGHLHSWASVQYSTSHRDTIFGVNAGCLINRDAIAFAYGKRIAQKPTLGTVLVCDGVPRFVPMR